MQAINLQDTSWSGDAASYMITRAVVANETIRTGSIYVEDGIRKKKTIPRIEVTDFIQRRAATPVSKGTVTVDGKVLEPKDLMLYYEFNPRHYEAHFYAEQLSPKLLGRELPVTAENFMMMQTMLRLGEFMENAIWRSRIEYDDQGDNVDPTAKGDTADAKAYFYFDGLVKRLLTDADTIAVTTPVALTVGNIISKFQACLDVAPQALLYKYGRNGLKFHVNYSTQRLYEDALSLTTYKNQDTTERGINRYKGYEIVPLPGIPVDTIILCVSAADISSNLWLGINSTEDNTLEMKQLQNNSELFFVKGLFKADTQVGFPDQAVIYTTLTD